MSAALLGTCRLGRSWFRHLACLYRRLQHVQQALGWHSMFWHRASSRMGSRVRSRQLVSEVRQQCSSCMSLPPGSFSPRVAATLENQLAFVVVIVGGMIGHRRAWSQAGLVMAALATLWGSPHLAPLFAPQVDGWHSMLACRVFTQGSSPAQFRASCCS